MSTKPESNELLKLGLGCTENMTCSFEVERRPTFVMVK